MAGLSDGFYTVKAADLQAELGADAKPLIIDLGNDEEFAGGYIEGAVHVPIQQLLADMNVLPAKDAAVVLVCQSGHRGGIGLMILNMLGWTNIRNLGG